MKINMLVLVLITSFGMAISYLAKAADLDLTEPDLGARYSQLRNNYGNASMALLVSELKPLTQFHQQYGGCYWVMQSVAGLYRDDTFAVGIGNYHLSVVPEVHGDPGEGPLFPPTPGTPSVEKIWRGPAVVFSTQYFFDDEVNLDGLGVTEFPKVETSKDENALSISETTNIDNTGVATEIDYFRKNWNGSLAMKSVLSMAGKVITGYGYCWTPNQSYMP